MPDKPQFTLKELDKMVVDVLSRGGYLIELVENQGVDPEQLRPYGFFDDLQADELSALAEGYDDDWAARGEFMGDLPPTEPKPNGHAKPEPPPDPLLPVDISTMADLPIEQPTYLDGHGFFMMDGVHVLNGDGGAGKTDIMCLLSIACTSGGLFCGLPVQQGPVLFYSAEEPIKRLRPRIHNMCARLGIDPASLHGLHIIDRSHKEAWLFGEKDKRLTLLPRWTHLKQMVADIKPVLVIIDNRMRVLAANQNDTIIAVSAITELDCLGNDNNSCVILVSHPSLSQISSGRGDSGSVSWGNAGRGRSLLRHPDDEHRPGDDDDGRRILVNMKATYSKRAQLDFQWADGFFQSTYAPPKADAGIGAGDKAIRIFKTLIAWHNKNHIRLSASKTSAKTYAPKVFSAMGRDDRGNLTYRDFEFAMKVLFNNGELINRPYGPPSRVAYELVLVKG